jgi:hypothetical protein
MIKKFTIYKFKEDKNDIILFLNTHPRHTIGIKWNAGDQSKLDDEDRGFKLHDDLRGDDDGWWEKKLEPTYNSKFARKIMEFAFTKSEIFYDL